MNSIQRNIQKDRTHKQAFHRRHKIGNKLECKKHKNISNMTSKQENVNFNQKNVQFTPALPPPRQIKRYTGLSGWYNQFENKHTYV